MSNPSFLDPYADLPDAEVHRTTIVCSKRDWAFISGIHGRKGSFQCTVYILITRLIQQLKEKGITDYDPERFESAVSGLTVSLADGSGTGGTPPNDKPEHHEAASGNDGRRATGVVQPSPGSLDKPRDVPVPRPTEDGKGQKRPKRGRTSGKP